MPSTPCRIAPRLSPAPSRRATAAVVPYARKMQRLTTAVSTVLAIAQPGELRCAEMPDDGGVGEQEQRLGD